MDFVNASLIGQQGGRSRLLTPALLIDLEVMEASLARMQAMSDAAGVALRPHGKAHKCAEIARRQIAAGAVGICSATPGEAEAFARAGIGDILMTSTFGTNQAAERLARLAAGETRLTVVVDAPEAVRLIGEALAAAGARARCLIDIDLGRHRSGAATPAAGRALAEAVRARPELDLAGIQAYAGHLSHCVDPAARRTGAEAAGAVIRAMLAGFGDLLPEAPVVTGCSTGAVQEELALGLYTELQCGSYLMMDAEYDRVDADGSGSPLFPTALFVATAVISANTPGLATTDGGEKRFVAKHATDPVLRRGAPEGASYRASSDEHGTIILPEGAVLPLGSLVEVQVPHCDPTVNLYDAIHACRGETVVEIWPVTGRGA